MSYHPSEPDMTAVIASKIISNKLCFLQRSIRRSTIESKCFKKVAVISITKKEYLVI
jgi:hypothetical protein